MFGLPGSRPTILINTAKIVLCVGGLSLAAAHWLSSAEFDRGSLARLADGRTFDPLTTGSIAPAKPGVRLDPCQMRP